jgi:cellulose synthase/poly-beta-1,6-N-acetylglucosamine synthase-like glycosyltransferase
MLLFALVFLWFLIIITIPYSLLIFSFTTAWFKMKKFPSSAKPLSTKVSIIVPVRNEEKNILNCLSDILIQDYPKIFTEIIIVDDHSEDATVDLVKSFIQNSVFKNIQLLELKNISLTGKKNAITAAIEIAEGDLIITTDADCRMGMKWLSSLINYYETEHPQMLVAPVCFHHPSSFFGRMQSLEFLSLIVSSASAIQLKMPVMCNGANLMYEKKEFNEVNGFEGNMNYNSGDDVFLMLKFKLQQKKINFLKSYDACVFTEPKASLRGFIIQRKRWVSKSRGYKNFSVIFVSLLVFLINFFLLVSFITSLFIPGFIWLALLFFGIKLLFDFPLMTGAAAFFKRKTLLWYYLPMQIVNIIYIPLIAIVGLCGKVDWKGRTIH